MDDFLKAIGRSFIVSSLIPASIFVLLAVLLIRPWLPPELSVQLAGLSTGTEIIIFSAVFGFTGFALYSLNISIYRLFEGYSIVLPWAHQAHARKLRRLLIRHRALEAALGSTEESDVPRSVLRQQLLQSFEYLQRTYPNRLEHVLPTEFGNILRAYEEYPQRNYGIDGVVAWPHLIEVISSQFMELHEENNNKLTFVMNSALLSWLLSALALASLVLYVGSQRTASSWTVIAYVGTILAAAGSGWLFYRGALPLAQEQGYLFRAAFDLFRFKLLELLRIKTLPSCPEEEPAIWRSIQYFWWAGLTLANIENQRNLEIAELEDSETETDSAVITAGFAYLHNRSEPDHPSRVDNPPDGNSQQAGEDA
jgi:hypothetical protein